MPSKRPKFWERPLDNLNQTEWEALCDGCGLCCLNKLEDELTGDVALTCVACRLLDNETAQCSQYDIRHQFVPDCIVLTPKTLSDSLYWLPETCAYVRRYKGELLPKWHHLITGSRQTVHDANQSVAGKTVPEFEIPEDDWERYIVPQGFPHDEGE